MSVKILVSGLAGSGKTSLLKDLKETLVVSCDGKQFPLEMAYIDVNNFRDASEMLSEVEVAVGKYQEAYGEFPKTVVFDSVSKIFEVMANSCGNKYTGFNIYSELNKEVSLFTNFLEDTLAANGVNIVLLSHSLYDKDTNKYSLIAQGNFAKKGGFYAEVDEAISIEVKSSKRVIHLRNDKMLGRTLVAEFEDNVKSEDFSLQRHLEVLLKYKTKNKTFKLN